MGGVVQVVQELLVSHLEFHTLYTAHLALTRQLLALAFQLTHTHTDTDTDTQTHRHTDTQRHTHTHTHTHTNFDPKEKKLWQIFGVVEESSACLQHVLDSWSVCVK